MSGRLSARSFLSYLPFFLALAVALLVRLAYWSDARAYAIGADEPDYVLPAQTLLREGRYVDTFISTGRVWTRVPLVSVLFSSSFLLTPDSAAKDAAGNDAALMQPRYDALNMLQIGESLVTIALIMLLAARCFPHRARRAAMLSGFIAALYPPLASSPAQRALSEPTAIMLIFAALYALSWWDPSPGTSGRRRLTVAVVVGLLLGAGSLARPIAFTFLPFAWLWFFVVSRAQRGRAPRIHLSRAWLAWWRGPLVGGLAATVMCFLVISPWTLYNYQQYGRFLLLDTASATAFWNYHNFRGEDINARMEALPNPADRLSLIVQEGTANILEYPDREAGDAFHAFFYFWHLESNSAVQLNAWDMTQRDPDVPDVLHADAALILVGLAGMCGLVGVGLRRPADLAGRTLLLVNLWLLAQVLLGIVVPYDGRYRLPAFPSIIVLGAGLLATAEWRVLFSPARAWRLLKEHGRVALASLVVCMWVIVGAYSPNIPPLLRSLYQSWRGDLALASGDTASAFGRYHLAQSDFPRFFWPYRHAADMARRSGMDDEARALYTESRQRARGDVYGMLGFGDLAARHPEWLLAADEQKWLSLSEDEWRGNPWNSFQPSPTTSIDIGSGRDIGYIRGFYTSDRPSKEFNYRWSRGRSTVRLPAPAGKKYGSLLLRMSAPAMGPSEPLLVSLLLDGSLLQTLTVPTGWAEYKVPLPRDAQEGGKTLLIDIISPTRDPAVLQPDSSEKRTLGVGVDYITLAEP